MLMALALVLTLNTLFFSRLYVSIFIEIGNRSVRFAGCTANPTSALICNKLLARDGKSSRIS